MPKSANNNVRSGETLLRALAVNLATAGWTTNELEDWRDCGWIVTGKRDAAKIDVIVSEIKLGDWMLQVAPHHGRGLLGALFGYGQPSATAQDVFEAAVTIHRALAKLEYVTGPQLWVWDNFPEPARATPAPLPP